MAAFRRFDPYAVLGENNQGRATLAGLASLAGAPAEIEIPARAPAIVDPCPTEENQERRGAPAKGANLAKPVSAPSWGEAEEERAAVVEHDARIPRAWAEGFARLDPDRPPADVPARRWLAFIDDIGRFLDSSFCAVAVALGWGPYDLFGCDQDRPFARIDRAGLLWLLNGDRLVALSENTAAIETRTGGRQTYRRKPRDPGRGLAWEIAGRT
jgi:hypothetical protein